MHRQQPSVGLRIGEIEAAEQLVGLAVSPTRGRPQELPRRPGRLAALSDSEDQSSHQFRTKMRKSSVAKDTDLVSQVTKLPASM